MMKKEDQASNELHAPVHPGEMTPHHQEKDQGPTITMQGVSGKKITGTVKVVKVIKGGASGTEHNEPEGTVTAPADISKAAQQPADVEKGPAVSAPVSSAVPSPTGTQAVSIATPDKGSAPSIPAAPVPSTLTADSAPQPEKPVAPAESAAQNAPAASPASQAPAAPATASAPAAPAASAAPSAPKAPAAPPTPPASTPPQQRPAAQNQTQGSAPSTPSAYGTPNRPQSGNYNRDRVPGHGNSYNAGYSPRPQGDSSQGYGNRPQGGPGQGGPGGYNRGPGGPSQGGPGGYNRGPGGPGQGGPGGPGGYNRGPGGPGGPGSYGNRPQGGPGGPGGYNRGPGGPGGSGGPGGYNRGPGGPGGPGGYNRGPGGSGGGFGGGGFDKDKDRAPSFGSRPQGAARPKPAIPTELQGKESTVRPRGPEPKRDDRREPKKDTLKSTADIRDKHNTLRQQAAVVSGKGINEALSDDVVLDTLYTDNVKGKRGRNNLRRAQEAPVRAVLTQVSLPETLTVKEFSEAIKKTTAEVIKKLIRYGVMATMNQALDFDTASLIADEFGIKTEKLVEVTEEEILFDDTVDQDTDLKQRPPVVVVMGHVDHGKTSILDRIRSANVVSGEAGGITQHIGAYTVRVKNRQITFLDTPGHEAFTTMRARGAQVTDIAILVVAADDGVMPQTIEAINHAKAANTQIIVAINKIDKEGANIDRVKQELSHYELIPEEWGGTTVMVPVSAKVGTGMDDLLEMVLLTADILDLKANPDKQAKGTVIEAKLDKNRGPVATVLVQRGTLRTGDTLVTGSIIGNVRAMADDKGNLVKKAGPSIPVEILGLPEVPEAGEVFYAVTDDKVARVLAEKRRIQQREKQLKASSHVSLDTLFSKLAAGEVKDLNVIIKADVQGSVEAVRQSLEKIGNEEVQVRVIHGAVGAITESDVRLAEVSNAIVIGFNVRPAANVSDLAKETSVDVRLYRVIYNAIEDVEAAMKGMLAPKFKENILGHAEVRQVFKVTGIGTIAGSYVTDGKIIRSAEVRVVRDGIVIHEGKLASLKRFKDDAKEVATGYECGIGIDRFNDIKEGDVFEAFEMQEIERS